MSVRRQLGDVYQYSQFPLSDSSSMTPSRTVINCFGEDKIAARRNMKTSVEKLISVHTPVIPRTHPTSSKNSGCNCPKVRMAS